MQCTSENDTAVSQKASKQLVSPNTQDFSSKHIHKPFVKFPQNKNKTEKSVEKGSYLTSCKFIITTLFYQSYWQLPSLSGPMSWDADPVISEDLSWTRGGLLGCPGSGSGARVPAGPVSRDQSQRPKPRSYDKTNTVPVWSNTSALGLGLNILVLLPTLSARCTAKRWTYKVNLVHCQTEEMLKQLVDASCLLTYSLLVI